MEEKFKITNEEINKMVLHSPYALPDAPYKQGLGSGQIKKYFYDFIIYLCEKLNIHLQDLGADIGKINEDLVLLQEKSQELHESDLQLYSDIMNEISRVSKEHGKSCDEIEEQMEEIRREIEMVNSLASGKSKVHSVPSLLNMMEYLYTDTDKVNVGDFILLADRLCPDFVVYSKTGKIPKACTTISWEEIQHKIDVEGDFTLDVLPGMAYLLIDRDVTVIAIESGVSSDDFVSKQEFQAHKTTYEPLVDSINDAMGAVLQQLQGHGNAFTMMDERIYKVEEKLSPKAYKRVAMRKVTEDVDVVEFENLNLSNFYVFITGGFIDGSSSTLYMNVNDITVCANASVGLQNNLDRWCYVGFFKRNDNHILVQATQSMSGSWTTYYNAQGSLAKSNIIPPNYYKYDSIQTINKISFYTLLPANGTKKWLNGTVFEIWGIEEDED